MVGKFQRIESNAMNEYPHEAKGYVQRMPYEQYNYRNDKADNWTDSGNEFPDPGRCVRGNEIKA